MKAGHLKGMAATAGAPAAVWLLRSTSASAARPRAGCTMPSPSRSTLAAVWASLAAMPAPAQAPHCTLTALRPWERQQAAAASSAVLAAL